ncbi:MAG: hypothetical protein IT335_15890, partial [Thermomicrobiales bacterium]|nr:hypothetical protein [Thermomicrobiales bacterium]
AYFTGAFTQAAPVAFVNFKDLDPDGNIGTDPTAGTPGEKVYEACQIYTLDVGTGRVDGNYYPGWDRRYTYRPIMAGFAGECAAPPEADTCPQGPGRHYEASAIVSNCESGAVTPIGVGYFTNNMADEPRPAAQGNCPTNQPCFDNYQTGTITMNQVTVVRGFCRSDVWSQGNLIHNPTGGTGVNQSFAGACCSYHWSRPKQTCP